MRRCFEVVRLMLEMLLLLLLLLSQLVFSGRQEESRNSARRRRRGRILERSRESRGRHGGGLGGGGADGGGLQQGRGSRRGGRRVLLLLLLLQQQGGGRNGGTGRRRRGTRGARRRRWFGGDGDEVSRMRCLSGGGVGERLDAVSEMREHASAEFVGNAVDGSQVARDFACALGETQAVLVDDGRVLLDGGLHALALEAAQVADGHFQDVGLFHLRSLRVVFFHGVQENRFQLRQAVVDPRPPSFLHQRLRALSVIVVGGGGGGGGGGGWGGLFVR